MVKRVCVKKESSSSSAEEEEKVEVKEEEEEEEKYDINLDLEADFPQGNHCASGSQPDSQAPRKGIEFSFDIRSLVKVFTPMEIFYDMHVSSHQNFRVCALGM